MITIRTAAEQFVLYDDEADSVAARGLTALA